MLRKQKSDGLRPPTALSARPDRSSLPGMMSPNKSSLDAEAGDPPRRKKSADKRKVSRVHLGRLQFLAEDCIEDEPDPEKPVEPHDFFMAASSGRIKTVSKFLEDGGDVNTVDSCDRSALHRASLYEQPAIVNLLIDRGANVNLVDKLYNTPLHWACRGASLEIVQTLVANNAKVNKKDQLHNTPLHVATRVGFLDCVNYLLECGARINEKDCEGDTPIHDAIRLARPKVVRTLILHGANMTIKNMNSKTASDMMLAWYSATKEAILNAEKERKQKGVDVEKEERSEVESRVNVKKFSIESYESWKEDLMKCGSDKLPLNRTASNDNLFKGSGCRSGRKLRDDPLLPLPEESIETQSEMSFALTSSGDDPLSNFDGKELLSMENEVSMMKQQIIDDEIAEID